ncbi:hypothetical protein KKH27_12225 [bacterium]|nr:hypothetical protein [bacterium]MBU1983921.1 hypothetical protein [bacterium]
MYRILGTGIVCLLVIVALGSMPALAFDSPQKYGVELRGGFGVYDMGDVTTGIESIHRNINRYRPDFKPVLNQTDQGPVGGLSFLFRPSAHTMWEVGYNAILDVENTVDSSHPDSASGQVLMHANEFFLKGHVIATLTERFHLDFGAGLSYYNTELQVQDNFRGKYYYDAVGRAWGLIGTVGLEYLLADRVGLCLQAGGRFANTTHFSYEENGIRKRLDVIDGTRPMEVNLTGGFGALGLRVYFDRVTKPVDFAR